MHARISVDASRSTLRASGSRPAGGTLPLSRTSAAPVKPEPCGPKSPRRRVHDQPAPPSPTSPQHPRTGLHSGLRSARRPANRAGHGGAPQARDRAPVPQRKGSQRPGQHGFTESRLLTERHTPSRPGARQSPAGPSRMYRSASGVRHWRTIWADAQRVRQMQGLLCDAFGLGGTLRLKSAQRSTRSA